MPRLAAQREDYLLKSLRDYKEATRRGYDATMDEVIRLVTDADIVDLSRTIWRGSDETNAGHAAFGHQGSNRLTEEKTMAWITPTLVEICIGLEINGYLPAEF